MLQPNLGTTLVLGAIVLSLLWVAGTPLVPLTGLAAAGAVVATGLALWAPYRRARVLAFLDPWADYQNTGYQNIQSLVGVASGGITGTGLGESRAKWGFLPYAHTDFIFAIIGEELGLIGALVVVALFVALCVLGARAALLAPDRFGMLLAAGVTVWFGVQAFVNIGAVIGILPDHRRAAAVRELRRLVAPVQHDRRRPAPERGPPGPAARRAAPAPRSRRPPGAVTAPSDLRRPSRSSREGARRATCSPRSPSPTRWWPPGTPASVDPLRRRRARHRGPPRAARPATR